LPLNGSLACHRILPVSLSKHTVDHEVVGLIFTAIAGVVRPGHLKLGDVGLIDLCQRRVVGSARISQVVGQFVPAPNITGGVFGAAAR
jgi:hypothetical protein